MKFRSRDTWEDAQLLGVMESKTHTGSEPDSALLHQEGARCLSNCHLTIKQDFNPWEEEMMKQPNDKIFLQRGHRPLTVKMGVGSRNSRTQTELSAVTMQALVNREGEGKGGGEMEGARERGRDKRQRKKKKQKEKEKKSL